ncbi:MAG: hypothetical protein CSA62_14870 [Planctomycetota bacterium]|nr:MAG: hypothetical protein CSA62_14870 [Planctomycetota bacterium]
MNKNFTPIGSYALVGIFAIVFVAFGLHSPKIDNELRSGAQMAALVVDGEPWRLISSCFMHFGVLHLGFNGYFLLQIGPWLERQIGTERLILSFLISGLGGSLATMLWYEPYTISGGASGGLFGLLGVLLAVFAREERSYGSSLRDPRIKWILSLVAINVVIGFMIPIISQTAHMGGLITGFIASFCLFKLPDARGRSRWPAPALMIGATLLLSALTLSALRPVHRSWYMAHSYWKAEGPRATELASALEAASIDSSALEFLRALKVLSRHSSIEPGDPNRIRFIRAYIGANWDALRALGLLFFTDVYTPTLHALARELNNNPESRIQLQGKIPLHPWRFPGY